MNPAQFKVYKALYDRRNEPVSPTIADIGRIIGSKSKSAIWGRLEGLEKGGYIKIDRGGCGRRNEYHLTSKRPAGFGHALDGFMVRDASGRFDPSSFRYFRLTPAHEPVCITIEERAIG